MLDLGLFADAATSKPKQVTQIFKRHFQPSDNHGVWCCCAVRRTKGFKNTSGWRQWRFVQFCLYSLWTNSWVNAVSQSMFAPVVSSTPNERAARISSIRSSLAESHLKRVALGSAGIPHGISWVDLSLEFKALISRYNYSLCLHKQKVIKSSWYDCTINFFYNSSYYYCLISTVLL